VSSLEVLAQGIGNTLIVTFGAFGVGAALGVPVALGRRSRRAVVRAVARAYVEIFRGVPLIAWVFIIYYGVAQEVGWLIGSIPAAIVALGLVSGAYLGEIYRAAIGAVPRGQWEAAAAIGLGGRTTLVRVVMPQSFRVAIPPAGTYAVGLLKDSSIASIIGAPEITLHAFNLAQATGQGLPIFLLAAGLYIALSVPLGLCSRWLDHRVRKQAAG